MVAAWFWLALAASWIFFLALAAYRTWRTFGRAGLWRIAGYLALLPVATLAIHFVDSQNWPDIARLHLSEQALSDHVEAFRTTGVREDQRAGLYRIDSTYSHDGCVMLETSSSWGGGGTGLANCPSAPTDIPVTAENTTGLQFEHLKGRWWRFEEVAPID
jgi:hypothetical protein